MPGHKGQGASGMEALDLTEIQGADSLYDAAGIIAESEENAARLFGCKTYYSTEGSSLCIRAMLFLLLQHAKENQKRPLILAGRNAHKTFLSGAALLGMDVAWLYGSGDSYLSCEITAEELERTLAAMEEKPVAVYLTTPDYLGTVADLDLLSECCHKYGVLLAVDCAHGAYLRFLDSSCYPTDHGADLCCSSAHKTLPVLTGGAYLHISHHASGEFARRAKNALALFGSTSPSYLILQSLDAANRLLAEDYAPRLADFAEQVRVLQCELETCGYVFTGDEPLKLTLKTKAYGYLGCDYAHLLRQKGIECEFADRDFMVLMFTPEIGKDGLERLKNAMLSIPKQDSITELPPLPERLDAVMTVREAMLAPSECLPIRQCAGRILASASVGCPPAVPIAVCGERINAAVLKAFAYYGIDRLWVLK